MQNSHFKVAKSGLVLQTLNGLKPLKFLHFFVKVARIHRASLFCNLTQLQHDIYGCNDTRIVEINFRESLINGTQRETDTG